MNKDLRKQCAEELIKIDFDGYGFGGYVTDTKTGKMNTEIAQYTSNLIPNNKIKFALGVGKPIDIVRCRQFGWDIFDCTLPTRDARHKRLYNFKTAPLNFRDLENPDIYEYLYINKLKYKSDQLPISEYCDCYTCNNYSRAYLRHLFEVKGSLALKLATIHNLRHYSKIIEIMRK